MGIRGLHKFVQPACKNIHLKRFRKQDPNPDNKPRLVFDIFIPIHQVLCSKTFRGESLIKHAVTRCFSYIAMFHEFGIKTVLVLDGKRLPAKQLTQERRAR